MTALLAAGHSSEMILDDYTAEELQVHYEAAIRLQSKREMDLARVIRVSNNAKSKDFRKFMKQLEDTPRRIDRAMGRRESVESIFNKLDQVIAKRRKNQ